MGCFLHSLLFIKLCPQQVQLSLNDFPSPHYHSFPLILPSPLSAFLEKKLIVHAIRLNSCLQWRKHYLVIVTGEWTPGYLSSVPSYVICLMEDYREITLLFCASMCSARNTGLTFVVAQTCISQTHLSNTFRKQVLDFAWIKAELTESSSPSAEPLPASNSPIW